MDETKAVLGNAGAFADYPIAREKVLRNDVKIAAPCAATVLTTGARNCCQY